MKPIGVRSSEGSAGVAESRHVRLALASLIIATVLALIASERAHAGDADGVAQACDAWFRAMAMVPGQTGAGARPCPFVHGIGTSVTLTVPGATSGGTNAAPQASSSAALAVVEADVESHDGDEGAAMPEAAPQSSTDQTFTLCGTAGGSVAQEIGRFVAGRPFGAELRSRADGCADLTISIPTGAVPLGASSQQRSSLSVAQGSAGAVAVEIFSANGMTQVRIGSGT